MAKRAETPPKSKARSRGEGGGPMLGQSRAIEVEAPPLPALPPPLPLSRIVGQGRAVGLLEDAIASKKLHHAWIFEGPEGVGKCTTAFAFASLLLDPTTECGLSGGVVRDESSPAQRLLRAGTHPDLQLITRELSAYHPDAVVRKKKQTNIPIDVVRHFVIAMGGLAPSAPTSMQSLARKVFIIDEADYMETASQNAILKYLEEPPPQVVLVLVCSSPHLLLPTIRSRCQRVGFTTLSRGQLDHWLSDAQERGEVPELSPQHREFLLGFADGAPGLLLRAVQGGVHHWYDTLAKPLGDAAQGIHTAELGGMMNGFIDTWAKAQVEQNDRISKQNANSVAAGWLFRLLSWHARQRLQRQATELATLGPDAPEPRALRDIDALQAAQAELEANCNMQMVMEKLSAELAGG